MSLFTIKPVEVLYHILQHIAKTNSEILKSYNIRTYSYYDIICIYIKIDDIETFKELLKEYGIYNYIHINIARDNNLMKIDCAEVALEFKADVDIDNIIALLKLKGVPL